MQLTLPTKFHASSPYRKPSPNPFISKPQPGYASVEVLRGDFGDETGEIVTIRDANDVSHVQGKIGNEDIDYKVIRWSKDGTDFTRRVGDAGSHNVDMTTARTEKDGKKISHHYGIEDGKKTDLTTEWTKDGYRAKGIVGGFDSDYQAVRTDSWRVFGDFGEFEGDYQVGSSETGLVGNGDFGDRVGHWNHSIGNASANNFVTVYSSKYENFESRVETSHGFPDSKADGGSVSTYTSEGFFGDQAVNFQEITTNFAKDSLVGIEKQVRVKGDFGNTQGDYERILMTIPHSG